PVRGNKCVTTFRAEKGLSWSAYNLYRKYTPAYISFKSTKIYPYPETNSWSCFASFRIDTSTTFSGKPVYENVGSVTLNDLNIPKEPRNGYMIMNPSPTEEKTLSGFYGDSVTFSLSGTDSSLYQSQSARLYVPKPLNVRFENNAIIPGKGHTKMQRTAVSRKSKFTLKWDVDTKNTQGVILSIQDEGKVDSLGYTEIIPSESFGQNTLLLKDDGEYVFRPRDFKNIPDNYELMFTISRRNIVLTKNGTRDLKLCGEEQIFIRGFVLVP
nr:hypothetical protein [Chitinophagales bacterium]